MALAVTVGYKAELASALLEALRRAPNWTKVLEAADQWKTRQELVKATGVDSTNISKVLGPLVAAGWLDELTHPESSYRRSLTVDAVLGGLKVGAWIRRRT